MPRLLPTKPLSIDELRRRAQKSAATAERDSEAVKFYEQAALAQKVVSKRADDIQRRIDHDARWRARRADIAGRLGVAQRTAWDLSDRIANARTATDDAIKAGDVDSASAHGMAVGSMQLTLQRAQSLVQDLQQELGSVPEGDVTPAEREQLPLLRAIALSPEKSHQYIVPTLKVDQAAELRALGRRVAQDEREGRFLRNQYPTPMEDKRVPA
jgi:hypothetical protein